MYELEPYVFEGEIVDDACERCGADGAPVIDPYALEIDGEEIEVVLCGDCYQERCDDI